MDRAAPAVCAHLCMFSLCTNHSMLSQSWQAQFLVSGCLGLPHAWWHACAGFRCPDLTEPDTAEALVDVEGPHAAGSAPRKAPVL